MSETTEPTLSKEAIRIEESIEEYVSRFGKIESTVPGRVRLRLLREYRTSGKIATVQELLAAQPGVENVSANHRTGSILVQYDLEIHRGHAVLEILRDLTVISEGFAGVEGEDEILGEGAEQDRSTGAQIADAIYDLELLIYDRTGLRRRGYLIPAAIAGFGVFQLASYGLALETLSGPFLLYIAWDVYQHLKAEPPLPRTTDTIKIPVEEAGGKFAPAAT